MPLKKQPLSPNIPVNPVIVFSLKRILKKKTPLDPVGVFVTVIVFLLNFHSYIDHILLQGDEFYLKEFLSIYNIINHGVGNRDELA